MAQNGEGRNEVQRMNENNKRFILGMNLKTSKTRLKIVRGLFPETDEPYAHDERLAHKLIKENKGENSDSFKDK